jgi:uncharacterized membrane protein
MTFLEGLSLVGVGATIFALIVGVFSVWNGRMTRREIIKAIKEMAREITEKLSELIVADGERTREILRKWQK